MDTRFHIRAADEEAVALLRRELGLAHFVASVLVARGIDTPEAARDFLTPSLERDWLNPNDIPGLVDVADALEDAIRAHKHLVVFGDFDLDGISATCVLTRALRELGADVEPFIPRRFDEGYGITPQAYERVRAAHPDVIVTVDCGISAQDEIGAILDDGVEVLITDHHEPGDKVPLAVPVADPKLNPDCPSAVLAGVGVALKLVQLLGARMGQPYLWRSYTDFATLGTVADLMPMRGENRALVTDGLAQINAHPRPCLAALLNVANVADSELTASNIGFTIAPRLNAAGRMGKEEVALKLLMCDDYDEACVLADELDAINDRRRAIEVELSDAAQEQAVRVYHGQRALVLAGRGWHEGVKGIVASRLVGMYGVPVVLFTIDGDEARGSGRSVGSVNLFAAVESVSDLLTRFGGHEAAVGVTLPTENLEEFAERMCAYMDALDEDAFHPTIDVDACVDLDELTLEAVERLDDLAPFGNDNPDPIFLAHNVVPENCRAVGADKTHFSCVLSDGVNTVSGIMFHCKDIAELLENNCVVDAAFTLQIDEWRSRRTVKAMLLAVVPAHSCSGLEACLDSDDRKFCDDLFEKDQRSRLDARPDGQLGKQPDGRASDGARLDSHPDEQLGKQPDGRASDVARLDSQPDEHPDGRVQEGASDPFAAQENAPDGSTCPDSRAERRALWRERAREDPAAFECAVVRAIIGEGNLHASQQEVIDRLRRGISTLAVMATGRGKSLTFQVAAITRALTQDCVSIFVYPLRALIADQAFHLRGILDRFGCSCAVLTGESTVQERARVYEGLSRGEVDIVLTTPEYLAFHVEDIAACARVGLLVVDEAHHIGQAASQARDAYTRLGEIAARFGHPTVYAATATAPDEVARDIMATLKIDESVFDTTPRDNLTVDDRRNIKDRDDYLAHLIADGEKTVVYVNSREETVNLARRLRMRLPQIAQMIGFYNAGLSRDERCRVEDLFRRGHLAVLVATSAFGEGVDIAGIRHVVLFHMPFNEVEFNQMSGRCGRDGGAACVHLLYGRDDIIINNRILAQAAPDHDTLAQVYRALRAYQRTCSDKYFPMDDDALAQVASKRLFPLTSRAAACAVEVFSELGLIDVQNAYVEGAPVRRLHVNENAAQVDLDDSVRYREGVDERELFKAFCDWAMHCNDEEVAEKVSHPIVPHQSANSERG